MSREWGWRRSIGGRVRRRRSGGPTGRRGRRRCPARRRGGGGGERRSLRGEGGGDNENAPFSRMRKQQRVHKRRYVLFTELMGRRFGFMSGFHVVFALFLSDESFYTLVLSCLEREIEMREKDSAFGLGLVCIDKINKKEITLLPILGPPSLYVICFLFSVSMKRKMHNEKRKLIIVIWRY